MIWAINARRIQSKRTATIEFYLDLIWMGEMIDVRDRTREHFSYLFYFYFGMCGARNSKWFDGSVPRVTRSSKNLFSNIS